MQLPNPPPHVALAGLRALKSVAVADGEFREIERRLISAVQRHVLRIDADIDALETITPDELAAAVAEPMFRKRIVGGCAMLTLIDADADDDERSLVTAYAKALDVKDKVRDVGEAAVRKVKETDLEGVKEEAKEALRAGKAFLKKKLED